MGGIIHQPFWNYQSENVQNHGRTIHGVVGCGYGGDLNHKEAPKEIIFTSDESCSYSIDCYEPSKVIKSLGVGHKVLLLLEGQAHCCVVEEEIEEEAIFENDKNRQNGNFTKKMFSQMRHIFREAMVSVS